MHPQLTVEPHPNTLKSIPAGANAHAIFTAINVCWQARALRTIPDGVTLRDDVFDAFATTFTAAPGSEQMTAYLLGWAILDMWKNQMERAPAATARTWYIWNYAVISKGQPAGVIEQSYTPRAVPPQIGGGATVANDTVLASVEPKSVLPSGGYPQTASSVLLQQTPNATKLGAIHIFGSYLGDPFPILHILSLVTEVLKFIWQHRAEEPIVATEQPLTRFTYGPIGDDNIISITFVDAGPPDRPTTWVMLADAARQVIVKPILDRRWESYEADCSADDGTRFAKIRWGPFLHGDGEFGTAKEVEIGGKVAVA